MATPEGGYFDIIVPKVANVTVSPFEIGAKSKKPHKRAVYSLACFFRREFGYDFVQYDENESDPNHVAFLWVDTHFCHASYDVPCIGATCFRWREYTNFPDCYAMQWIWIHPYHRRTGLLRKAWPVFKKRFGYFIVEPPYSAAMQGFLVSEGVSVDEVELVF